MICASRDRWRRDDEDSRATGARRAHCLATLHNALSDTLAKASHNALSDNSRGYSTFVGSLHFQAGPREPRRMSEPPKLLDRALSKDAREARIDERIICPPSATPLPPTCSSAATTSAPFQGLLG